MSSSDRTTRAEPPERRVWSDPADDGAMPAGWPRGRGYVLEIGVGLASLASLWLCWSSLLPTTPESAMPSGREEIQELAALEDAFARNRGDLGVARSLSERYLALERPRLAITVLRAADPQLLQDPGLSHRLARAYEASGRVLDALATADLAYARCARALGSSEASSVTPVPAFACDERELASLRVHREALVHLARWGVQDPSRDHRTAVAYQLAQRRVRLAATGGYSDSTH